MSDTGMPPSGTPSSGTPDTAPEPAPPAASRAPRARRPYRGPVLLVIGAAIIASLVIDQSSVLQPTPATPASALAIIAADPTVPSFDAVSTSWYCAEGTATNDGRADETVIVASLADRAIDATITVMTGGDPPSVSKHLRVEPRAQVEVPVSTMTAVAEPGVVVEIVGGQAIVAHEVVGQGDLAVEPCARDAATDWYFANGTTVRGAQQFLVLFNPFGDDAIVDISFLTDTGVLEPDQTQGVVVPRRSRVSVPVHQAVERQTLIAAHVHARAGRVVAERAQIFDGSVSDGVPVRKGIALSLGSVSPGRTWEFAFGDGENSAAQSVAIANFGARPTSVEVSVRLADDETIVPKRVNVPGQAVVTVDTAALAPIGASYTVIVQARDTEGPTTPIVAEVLTSWPPTVGARSVASSLGTTRTARRWVIALPDLPLGTTAVVKVANPSTEPATAALLAQRAGDTRSPTSQPELAIPAAEFGSFDVTDMTGRVLVVTADHPVVVALTIVGDVGGSESPAVPDLLARG